MGVGWGLGGVSSLLERFTGSSKRTPARVEITHNIIMHALSYSWVFDGRVQKAHA